MLVRISVALTQEDNVLNLKLTQSLKHNHVGDDKEVSNEAGPSIRHPRLLLCIVFASKFAFISTDVKEKKKYILNSKTCWETFKNENTLIFAHNK